MKKLLPLALSALRPAVGLARVGRWPAPAAQPACHRHVHGVRAVHPVHHLVGGATDPFDGGFL